MLRNRNHQEWFFPQDFMQPHLGELFVGYEASARLSELASDYGFIESKREGKYMVRKLLIPQLIEEVHKLPTDVRASVQAELRKQGLLNVVVL